MSKKKKMSKKEMEEKFNNSYWNLIAEIPALILTIFFWIKGVNTGFIIWWLLGISGLILIGYRVVRFFTKRKKGAKNITKNKKH